jgi:hypothetical protein
VKIFIENDALYNDRFKKKRNFERGV